MHDQQRYQVRFDWGEAGARRIARSAHVVVVADELDSHGRASGAQLAAAIAETAGEHQAVLCTTEASSVDAAAWILRLQETLGERVVIAVVAAGSLDDDGFRPTVEDQLAAGAVVDALAAVGIDFSSPEAAAACAAFAGLRRATGHLLTASVSAERGSRGASGAREQRLGHPAVCAVLREFSAAA